MLESRALTFSAAHDTILKAIIVRPGGVATKSWIAPSLAATIFGENMCVRVEELGAYMTYAAVEGEAEESLVENVRVSRKGRELLAQQKNES